MALLIVGLKNNMPFVIKAIAETRIKGKSLSQQIDENISSLHDMGFHVRSVTMQLMLLHLMIWLLNIRMLHTLTALIIHL